MTTPQPPDADLSARVGALSASVHDLADAARTDDADGFAAAFAALRQVSGQIDMQAFLNALHVPADAGEHEPALRRILLRIPDGWGRWISCRAGWYALLAEAEERLSAISPGYEVHQVKEKYGTLRLYAEPCLPDPYEAVEPSPAAPSLRGGSDEEWAAWEERSELWHDRRDAWADGPGAEALARIAAQVAAFEAVVGEIERRSASTCELCGAPGTLRCTRAASPWYTTTCAACAGDLIPVAEQRAWYERERPRIEAELRVIQRDGFRRVYGGTQVVVCCATPVAFAVPCRQANTADAARALVAAGGIDTLFVADDEVGCAAMALLAEQVAPHRAALAESGANVNCAPSPAGAPRIVGLSYLRSDEASALVSALVRSAVRVCYEGGRPDDPPWRAD